MENRGQGLLVHQVYAKPPTMYVPVPATGFSMAPELDEHTRKLKFISRPMWDYITSTAIIGQ
jgi:hypothetical protein